MIFSFQPCCAHNIMIHITQTSLTWFGVRRVSGHAFFPLIKGVCAHRTGQRMPTTQFLKSQIWRFFFFGYLLSFTEGVLLRACLCALHSFLNILPLTKPLHRKTENRRWAMPHVHVCAIQTKTTQKGNRVQWD